MPPPSIINWRRLGTGTFPLASDPCGGFIIAAGGGPPRATPRIGGGGRSGAELSAGGGDAADALGWKASCAFGPLRS